MEGEDNLQYYYNYTGGLVGCTTGSVEYSYNLGDVYATLEEHGGWYGQVFAGGLVGSVEPGGTIQNSYSQGNKIMAEITSKEGIVQDWLDDLYTMVGGVAGQNNKGTVKYCYATGEVGSVVPEIFAVKLCDGGVVGYVKDGSVEYSYFNSDNFEGDPLGGEFWTTSGKPTHDNVAGLTTAQMQGQEAATNMVGFADAVNEEGTPVWNFIGGGDTGISPDYPDLIDNSRFNNVSSIFTLGPDDTISAKQLADSLQKFGTVTLENVDADGNFESSIQLNSADVDVESLRSSGLELGANAHKFLNYFKSLSEAGISLPELGDGCFVAALGEKLGNYVRRANVTLQTNLPEGTVLKAYNLEDQPVLMGNIDATLAVSTFGTGGPDDETADPDNILVVDENGRLEFENSSSEPIIFEPKGPADNYLTNSSNSSTNGSSSGNSSLPKAGEEFFFSPAWLALFALAGMAFLAAYRRLRKKDEI
jgi:hypothetical protein